MVAAVGDGVWQGRLEAVYDRAHRGRATARDSTYAAFGRAVGLDGDSCVSVVVRSPACATVEAGQTLRCWVFRA